jgi:aldehyde dehydrogenase (NAD+)
VSLTEAQRGDALPSGLFIGGEWVTESSAGLMAHISPITGQVQRDFVVAGPAEIDRAVAAARAALPAWREVRPVDRRDILREIARLFRERADEFALVSTLEVGMVSPMAAFQAPRAAEWFDYYAGWADRIEGQLIPFPGALDYTLPEPVGVVAVIITWNGPTGSLGMKVAPALAAGCCVVLKPPELAPFSSNLFAQLCADAGLPAGVLSVVPGAPDAGDRLARHPGIDKISFTGGPATARLIQAAAAESLTPLVLELGGKSANLVLDDADLEAAARQAAQGIVTLTGQACVAPTRLLVHEAVYDDIVDAVLDQLGSVQVGDPFDAATTMGPVVSEAACRRILSMVDRASAESPGKLVLGGHRLGGDLAGGFFIAPTVFTGVSNSGYLAQHEVFGPVLSILRFARDTEAVTMANDSPFGLAAYVHTRDLNRAHRLAAQLDVGNVAINGGASVAGPYAPFGGFKDSGYGKEGGSEGVREFVRIKNVNIKLG